MKNNQIQAETASYQSEEIYRSIIERITDSIIVLDKNWRFTYINSSAGQNLGPSSANLLGQFIWDELPQANTRQLREASEKAMAEQQYFYYEQFSNIYKVWFEYHIYPSPDGLTIIFRDINARKKREEDANKLARRNEMIIDMMPDNFIFSDEELNILDVNPAICRDSGFSRQELLNIKISDFDAKLSGEEIKENRKNISHTGNFLFDTKTKTKNGNIVDKEVTVTKMKIDGQTFYASFSRDISESVKREAEIKKSNERFELIGRTTQDALWEVEIETGNRWANEMHQRMYGVKKFDAVPDSKEWEERIHPEERQRVIDSLDAALKSGKDKWQEEYRFNADNRGWIYIYDRTYIVYDEDEKAVRMLGSMMDITDLKKAKETLHSMEQEILNQKVQEQKKLSRAIINTQEKERDHIGRELHDNVNQILAGARLYLSMAGKQNETTKELVKYPMELLDSSIDEIRLLTHKHATPKRDVDLKELVQTLLDHLDKTTNIKTNFVYKVAGKIIGDDLKINIYRILQEQINNITKHAAPKNAGISILADNDIIKIMIKDDGKGFDVNQKREGIGFSNMSNRIDSFNGEMVIKSTPGKGCDIQIKIPY